MKLAVAILDTEGGMLRLGKQHTLWNVCFMFKNTVDTITRVSKKMSQGHTITYTTDKNAESMGREKPIRVLLDSLQYVLESNEATGVIAICWNKRHDRRVVEHIDFGFPIYFVDGIDIHKQLRPRYRGKNSLETLSKLYKVSQKQHHTALRDCVDTEKVLVCALNHIMKDDVPRDFTHVLNHGIFKTLFRNELIKASPGLSTIDITKSPMKSPKKSPKKSLTKSPTKSPVDNYEYFEFDNKTYKMRKGWKINRHKNFGLYVLDENYTYKSVHGEPKDEILHNVWFTKSSILSGIDH